MVTHSTATQFSFIQQPTNTVSGSVITPAISLQLRDIYHNNVPTSGISATASLLGSGTLSGTTTIVTDTNGVLTFSNLSIVVAGSKQIVITSTGFVNDTSSSFTNPVLVITICFDPATTILKFENVNTPFVSVTMVVVPLSVPDPNNNAVADIPDVGTFL